MRSSEFPSLDSELACDSLTMEYSESDVVPVPGLDFKRTGSFYLASITAYFYYYFNELIIH